MENSQNDFFCRYDYTSRKSKQVKRKLNTDKNNSAKNLKTKINSLASINNNELEEYIVPFQVAIKTKYLEITITKMVRSTLRKLFCWGM